MNETLQTVLLSVLAVAIAGGLITAIKADKNRMTDRKNDFFSQCQLDGYKLTDCYVKWKVTH